MVTPSYMLSILDEYREPGARSARKPAAGRHLRRGALDQRHARPRSSRPSTCMRSTSTASPRSWAPASPTNASRPRTACTSGRIISTPRSSTPVTGEVLPDGEMGELVFTSLTKEAFPIIRYRTRDLTRLLPGTARSMRRMEKVTGRSDDMIILRGVNVFPTQIEEHQEQYWRLVHRTRGGARSHRTLHGQGQTHHRQPPERLTPDHACPRNSSSALSTPSRGDDRTGRFSGCNNGSAGAIEACASTMQSGLPAATTGLTASAMALA
jgi:hypothetical protein